MEIVPNYHKRMKPNRAWSLAEDGWYFEGRVRVFLASRRAEQRLKMVDIPYALAGILAMFTHGYRQFCTEIEIWIAPADWPKVEERFADSGYARIGTSRKFHCGQTDIVVVFCTCDTLPTSSEIIDDIPTVTLPALIESKLIEGRNPARMAATGDVQEMIKTLELTETFAEKLAPLVQAEYRYHWNVIDSPPPHLL